MTGLLSAKDATFNEEGRRIPHKSGTHRRVVTAPQGDLAADLARGRVDKVFWTRRFLGIEEHPGQRRFSIAATMRGPDGYSPAFLDLALVSGNQAGKTINLATTILHQTFYKLGLKPPDPEDAADVDRWTRERYHWYHISYEGKVANLVHNDLRSILAGSHPAQRGRGCPLVEELGPIIDVDGKENGEFAWVRIHPAFGGGQIHFRHTNEKAKAILGIAMNGESFDECAFELYLMEIRDEVMHWRRVTTGGPIYWSSTPTEGYNAFADLWSEGDPDNPHRSPRKLSLRMSTRDNIGYGITQEAFDDLIADYDPRLVPQNIDGHFIEAIDAYFNATTVNAMFQDIPEEVAPEAQHRYVQGCDPGISHDATWGLTLDYTAKPMRGVRAVRASGRQALPAVIDMIRGGHLRYNENSSRCTTIIDETGMGGKMYRQEFSIIRPLRTFDFAGTKAKKLNLLANLKAVIDRGDLILPRKGSYWPAVRRQLLGYKLDDKKIEQDAVMTLAMAVHHATRNSGSPIDDPSFDFFGD